MWQMKRTGFSVAGPAARIRTTRFILFGSGPSRCTSSVEKPASRKRFSIALVAAVTLPLGVSVVLISMSCLKMSRASAFSAGDVVGSVCCASAERPKTAVQAATARSVRGVWRGMTALYGSRPTAVFPRRRAVAGLQDAPYRFIVLPRVFEVLYACEVLGIGGNGRGGCGGLSYSHTGTTEDLERVAYRGLRVRPGRDRTLLHPRARRGEDGRSRECARRPLFLQP